MIAEPELARRLGPGLLTLYGVGTTIGAGIYVLIGEVAARAGAWTPYSFLLAALLAGVTALSFTELSARMPKSAGEALYVREAFASERLSLLVGLMVAAAGMISAASVVVGGVGYLRTLIAVPEAVAIVVLCATLGGLAVWGIAESTLAAAVLTLVEIGGLVLVVATGVAVGGAGGLPVAEILAPTAPFPLVGVFAGAVLAFYAFIGFEDIVNVAEEVKAPARTMPIAIVATLVIAGGLYLAVSVTALAVLPLVDLAGSEAPLALVYAAGGGDARILGAIAVLATVNGVLVQMVMASRVLFGLSRQGSLPVFLGRVNPITHTPVIATVLVVGVIVTLALIFPIATLAGTTSLVTLAVFALCNLALWRLKRRGPTPPEAPDLPIWLPLAGAVVSLAVLAVEIGRRISVLL
ncbi:APC family permease [Thalassobaculum litoreum]|uniref:Amino acid/polyamine/organocation transporter, APC superfamily (TC 2.A.3) n=1 Tax=Thalassobaculum litoreum DSM 18839 TaxID=1123362 RepID=A0A8G2F4M4_9PROT|nr:amino acid permease [Thalassobaculum litoreum]SDG23129.1 amino acid/polyamine/organocation transporter, APC superfamily (TC 2.A.3) [Thalassobaculum litoreum DSM 18839]